MSMNDDTKVLKPSEGRKLSGFSWFLALFNTLQRKRPRSKVKKVFFPSFQVSNAAFSTILSRIPLNRVKFKLTQLLE